MESGWLVSKIKKKQKDKLKESLKTLLDHKNSNCFCLREYHGGGIQEVKTKLFD